MTTPPLQAIEEAIKDFRKYNDPKASYIVEDIGTSAHVYKQEILAALEAAKLTLEGQEGELKPCPHCNAEAIRHEGMGETWIQCSEQCQKMRGLGSVEKVKGNWNARHNPAYDRLMQLGEE